MDYLTIWENVPSENEHLNETKRKYSHWQKDEVNYLSVKEQNATEREQRITQAKRKYSQWLVVDQNSYYSIHTFLEDAVPGSFCSDTISLYDSWLRRAYTLACLSLLFLMFAISYMFFFKAPKEVWDSLLIIDMLYTYIMFLRSRTGYMVNGIEERNLIKVRNKYNRSVGFILDVISVVPLAVIGRFLPNVEETFYAVGRQKQYIRLHFITHYLGKCS